MSEVIWPELIQPDKSRTCINSYCHDVECIDCILWSSVYHPHMKKIIEGEDNVQEDVT